MLLAMVCRDGANRAPSRVAWLDRRVTKRHQPAINKEDINPNNQLSIARRVPHRHTADKKATEDHVLERLKSTYSNVIGAWLRSGIPLLRLLPISAGIFSGKLTESMPRLTCMALMRAIQEMPPDEAQSMQERIKATEGEYPIQLCIFEEKERPFYEKALRSAEK